MSNILKVYIDTSIVTSATTYQSLDLFDDETVSLNSSVQNVKDISKLFTDYTQTFSVPASANNNEIFRHYYNVDITDGYDASIRKSSKLELNNIPFKDGRIRLDSVNMKDGKADSYKVTFFGEITKLMDRFGDDELNDLGNELSGFTHSYDFDTVKGLMAGTSDVTYPLISSERDWRWNTFGIGNTEFESNEIKYHTPVFSWGFGNYNAPVTGIRHTELKPALRLLKIIEAIERKYEITFSNDFFNSSSHFNDIFMWANRNTDEGGVKLSGGTEWQTVEIGTGFGDEGKNGEFKNGIGPKRWAMSRYGRNKNQIRSTEFEFTVTPLPGFESVPYKVKFDNDISEEITGTKTFTKDDFEGMYYGVVDSSHRSRNTLAEKKYVDFQIQTDSEIQFNAYLQRDVKWRKYQLIGYDTTHNIDNFGSTFNGTESGVMYLVDQGINGNKGALPNMKITDLLDGLIKMFNLVIVPITEDSFTVQTLDDWYADGAIVDVSEYLSTAKHTVKRPDLNKSISFKYEPTKAIIGKYFAESTGQGYGDLEAPNIVYDGTELDIEVPFENFMNERLTDEKSADSLITTIHVGKMIDFDDSNKAKTVESKPILFYNNVNYTIPTDIGPIQLANEGEPVPLYVYNVASQSNSLINTDITQSLNFSSEINTFTHNTPPNNQNGINFSLYANYWVDYITTLYEPSRRIFNFEARMPVDIISDLKLNDKLIIDDRRYNINNLQINLTTSDVKMELLNEIYDNTLTGETHASITSTNANITCAVPTVSLNGSNSTGLGLSYLWTTVGGTIVGSTTSQDIVASAAGTYTLTITDDFGITDNSTYTVVDLRISPTVTISASAPELSYTAQTIDLTSSLDAGYVLTWTTPEGNIVSGDSTSVITINTPGVYDVVAVQNNTGCSDTDTITITAGDLELPSTPDGLYVSGNTSGSTELWWSESTDDVAILNYDVYLDGVYYGTTPNAVPHLSVTGLTNGDTVQLKVLARDTSGNISPFSDLFYLRVGGTGADGADGLDAKAIKLTSAAYIINYDINGLNPNPSSIELTGTTQNIATPWFRFNGDTMPSEPLFSVGTGNTDVATFTSPSGYSETPYDIVVEASDGDQIQLADDNITIASVKAGTDGYTVVLSNDSHTLPTTNVGVVTYTGSGTEIIVYKGATQLAGISSGTPTIGQYKVTAVGTDITVGTLTPGTPLTVGDHNTMVQNNASIEYTIDIESLQTVTKLQTFSKSIEGQDGSGGTAAKTNKLIASTYIITYDDQGVEEPAGQEITFTATAQNHDGTVYYDFKREGVSKQNSILDTYVMVDADEPIGNAVSDWSLDTRENSTVGTIIATDTVSIFGLQDSVNGLDGLTPIMTNEAHTLPTTNTGVVNYTGSGTDIYVYEGNDILSYDGVGTANGTWKVTVVDTNISVGSLTDFGTFLRVGNGSVMNADTASIQFTITGKRVDGTAFTLIKVQTLAKSNAGDDGTDGTDGTNGTNGIDGSDGVDSQIVNLTANNYIIKYDSAGVETPAGQSISLTATGQNTVGTIYYQFIRNGVTTLQNTTSNTHTLIDGNEPDPNETVQLSVNMRQSSSVGTIIASDTISVVGLQDAEGLDGLTVIVSNEAHTFAADEAGTVTSYASSGTQIKVYEGVDTISYNGVGTTPGTFKITAFPGSITTGSFTDSGTYVTVNNHSNMTVDQTVILYLIQGERFDGQIFTITKQQSFGKSKAGTDGVGTDGDVGKLSSTGYVYYQLATDTPPTAPADATYTFNFSTGLFSSLPSNWSTTPPIATGGGKYWLSVYNVTETTSLGGVGLADFATSVNSLQFDDIVTFTNLASTTGSTVINGGNITTGSIASNNYIADGGSDFSSTGTLLNLIDGSMEMPGFAVDSSGNASFNGSIEGGTIDIGGADTSSFHVNAAGQVWLGAATYATAPFKINNDGNMYIDNNIDINVGDLSLIVGSKWQIGNDGLTLQEHQTSSVGGFPTYTGGQVQFASDPLNKMFSERVITTGPTYTYIQHQYVRGSFEWRANNSGSQLLTYGTGGTNQLRCTGDIVAYYSDERLKTNLGNISNPLDKIDSLNGFKYVNNELANSFDYTDDKSQVGVSAQEVQEVLPEVVKLAPFDVGNDGKSKSGEDYLTVDYAKLVPLLIEGIKELRAEVNELKKQIK